MAISRKLCICLSKIRSSLDESIFSSIVAEILNMASSSCDRRLRRSIDLLFGIVELLNLLNLAEIIIILEMKREKKVFEIVIISLSASDFMFGSSNIEIANF